MLKVVKVTYTLLAAGMILLGTTSAKAQTAAGGAIMEKEFHLFDFTLNAKRLEGGVTLGQAGAFTEYARFGMGAYVLFNGFYLDFIKADPQHKYEGNISDTKWDDNAAFSISTGYQIPILKWLRIMPVLGYAQTNYGVTDGSSINIETDETASWYHDYKVTPGSRSHYFTFGGGISIQPCKWFSIHAVASSRAIYGGIGIDIISLATR